MMMPHPKRYTPEEEAEMGRAAMRELVTESDTMLEEEAEPGEPMEMGGEGEAESDGHGKRRSALVLRIDLPGEGEAEDHEGFRKALRGAR